MRLKITGGQRLQGTVEIGGAKNAFLPLIAATILVKGRVTFHFAPRLTDTDILLDILADMGASITWPEAHRVCIDTTTLDATKLDRKKVRRLRGSVLLLGPMLARFKRVLVPEPGGCSIGNRPIDAHLRGLEQLGGQCETQEDGSVEMETKALKGSYVILPEFSVTATENMIMAACLAKGHTSIRLAAAEPHVQELCRFLVACGARIEGIGTHSLEIEGERDLTAPAKAWDIMSDTTEAMTFGVAAALTRGDIMMTRVDPSHLDAIRSLCTRIGIRHEIGEDSFRVIGGGHWEAFKLQALIYPGFSTDMQPLFGLVATQCQGASMIQDPLFESRLGYVAELSKMGANAMILDPHRAVIHGPTPLRGTEIRSLDLRAGATLLIAGMIASGETIIHDAEVIDRGYENIDTRLAALGALIQREAV